MRKLLSTKYSAGAFNVAMLLLRLISGILIMMHGYQKLVNFGSFRFKFINFMGIGTTNSLALTVFAEFFCGLFIIIGLFTRLAAIPLIIVMCVIIFKVNEGDIFGKGETPMLYLAAFISLLLLGAGRASVDGLMAK
ncbi:MAG: DoxX family protein [Ferruginibacter sp.]